MVDSVDLTKDNISNVRLTFPSKNFKSVSKDAKGLISYLLTREQRCVCEGCVGGVGGVGGVGV